MAKQMKTAAKIYLHESAVLEEARDELARELDDLWDTIWKETEPKLEKLAQSYACTVHLFRVEAEKGNYGIKPLPKGAIKTTKGNVKTDGKGDKRLRIFISDPRRSETPASYDVKLKLTQIVQPAIKKQYPAAPDKLKELIAKHGLKGLFKWNSGTLWSTSISVDPDDLDKTTSEITDTLHRLFCVITEFEKWQARAATSN